MKRVCAEYVEVCTLAAISMLVLVVERFPFKAVLARMNSVFSWLTNYITVHAFVSDVVSNVLAGLILVCPVAYVIQVVLAWYNRPRLSFLIETEDGLTDSVEIGVANEQGERDVTLRLKILNQSPTSFSLIYYTLVFPSGIHATYQNLPNSAVDARDAVINHQAGPDGWSRIMGRINSPIFPSRVFDFPYEIKMRISQAHAYEVYYYFSTDRGVSPGSAAKVVNPPFLGGYEKCGVLRLTNITKP